MSTVTESRFHAKPRAEKAPKDQQPPAPTDVKQCDAGDDTTILDPNNPPRIWD